MSDARAANTESISVEEYARRYQTRFADRAMVRMANLTRTAAENLARADWEALMPAEHMSGCYVDDPEGAADESLSYYEDDGDE